MKFSEGEEVLAKHPNSDEYSKGKVLSIRGERYKIQFETGMEQYVHSTHIKINRQSRSATRTSTRGKKSPSRYSPARKSPGRRSPGRPPSASRQSTRITKLAKMSLPQTEVPINSRNNDVASTKTTDIDEFFTESIPLQTRLKEQNTVTRRSTRLLSGMLKSESDLMLTITRNNRAISLPLERKSQLYDFSAQEIERGHSVQRDQDLLQALSCEQDVNMSEKIIEKRKKEVSLVSEPQEWGGWVGSLILIVLSPLVTILPQFMCTQGRCSFGYPNLPMNLSSYINLEAFSLYLGFLLFVTIISTIPIGRKIDGPQSRIGRLQYRLNGLLCGLLSLCIFAACVYNELGIIDLIIENNVQFSITGWVLGVILSCALFVKGGNAPVANLNIHGSTNSVIYNFWQGREINPRIGPVDFKMALFRTSMIAMILVNSSILIKIVKESEDFTLEYLNVGALLVALLEIIYATDTLFFESTLLTTFEVMYEGTGYMLCAGYLLYPFLPTLATKYMLYHKMELTYLFIFPVTTFSLGYFIYRLSNLQKNELRNNPLSPSIAHLEMIPTARGKKLIVSGLWGYLRHPNYLGDIIMWWSVSCISLSCDILLYYYPVVCTLLLVHRAVRDNERCKMRYGLAWEQYMSRVKYMIFYRIF